VYTAPDFIRREAPLKDGESYLRPKNNGRGWQGVSYLLGFSRDKHPLLEALLPPFRLMVLDGSALGTDSLPTLNKSTDEDGDIVIIDLEQGHSVRAAGTCIVSVRLQVKVRGEFVSDDAASAGEGAGTGQAPQRVEFDGDDAAPAGPGQAPLRVGAAAPAAPAGPGQAPQRVGAAPPAAPVGLGQAGPVGRGQVRPRADDDDDDIVDHNRRRRMG